MKFNTEISILPTVLACISIIINIFTLWYAEKNKRELRLNQIVVENKTNKKLGVGTVYYDVVVRNMSDVIVSDVYLVAPDGIKSTHGEPFVIENNKVRKLILGDISPSGVKTKNIEMYSTDEAQLKEFYIEFTDVKGKRWIKKPGEKVQKLN